MALKAELTAMMGTRRQTETCLTPTNEVWDEVIMCMIGAGRLTVAHPRAAIEGRRVFPVQLIHQPPVVQMCHLLLGLNDER